MTQRKAKIISTFSTLFTNAYGFDVDDIESIDEDNIAVFENGTEVEILKEIPAGEFGEYRAFVIFKPETRESATVSGVFLEVL